MNKIECNRCKHTWIPRVEYPVECPKCKNYLTRSKYVKSAKKTTNSLK